MKDKADGTVERHKARLVAKGKGIHKKKALIIFQLSHL